MLSRFCARPDFLPGSELSVFSVHGRRATAALMAAAGPCAWAFGCTAVCKVLCYCELEAMRAGEHPANLYLETYSFNVYPRDSSIPPTPDLSCEVSKQA